MSVPIKKIPETVWSATIWEAITPNDNVDLPFRPRAIVLGTSGDVEMTDWNGNTEVIPSLVEGIMHPCSPTRILAGNTTATGIVIVA